MGDNYASLSVLNLHRFVRNASERYAARVLHATLGFQPLINGLINCQGILQWLAISRDAARCYIYHALHSYHNEYFCAVAN